MKFKQNRKLIIIITILIAIIGGALLFHGQDNMKNESLVGNQEQETELEGNLTDFNEETDPESHNNSNEASPSGSESQETEQEVVIPVGINFPYEIPDTGLIINQIESYDGQYFEDGGNSTIEDVATIIVTNNGSTNVEYAEIIIKTKDDDLTFAVSSIPKGKSVVAQEKNKKKLKETAYFECSATVAELDTFEKNENLIKVEENEAGGLTVTNLSDETIPGVRLFYKYYMADEKLYVGGITFSIKISNLQGKEARDIFPKHYAKDFCEIMMVRVYDENK